MALIIDGGNEPGDGEGFRVAAMQETRISIPCEVYRLLFPAEAEVRFWLVLLRKPHP